MRAIVIEETGGPEQLALRDVPDPDVSGGTVPGACPCRGNQLPRPPRPPGELSAGAGAADDAGAGGRRRDRRRPSRHRAAHRRRLCGAGGGGRGAARSRCPTSASFAEGASFLLTFLTAWIPVTRQVRLEPGQTVLVHAGSGGVGTAAIQVARHSRRARGGDGLDGGEAPLLRRARRRGGVRLRRVRRGGEAGSRARSRWAASCSRRASRILAPLGTVVGIGYAGGWWEELNPALLVGRNVGVQGFYLGRLMARRPDIVAAAAGELLELWSAGAIKPVVGAEFPLAEAADAHG